MLNELSQRKTDTNTIQLHSLVNFEKPNKLAKGWRRHERSKPRYTLLTTENKLIKPEESGWMGNQWMGIAEVTTDQYQALYSRVESLCGKPDTISYCV